MSLQPLSASTSPRTPGAELNSSCVGPGYYITGVHSGIVRVPNCPHPDPPAAPRAPASCPAHACSHPPLQGPAILEPRARLPSRAAHKRFLLPGLAGAHPLRRCLHDKPVSLLGHPPPALCFCCWAFGSRKAGTVSQHPAGAHMIGAEWEDGSLAAWLWARLWASPYHACFRVFLS